MTYSIAHLSVYARAHSQSKCHTHTYAHMQYRTNGLAAIHMDIIMHMHTLQNNWLNGNTIHSTVNYLIS